MSSKEFTILVKWNTFKNQHCTYLHINKVHKEFSNAGTDFCKNNQSVQDYFDYIIIDNFTVKSL